jgi:acetyl-CoA acyltransferase
VGVGWWDGGRGRQRGIMESVYLVSAVRSAVAKGKKDGALSSVHPVDLSAQVMRAAIAHAGVEAGQIDDIY